MGTPNWSGLVSSGRAKAYGIPWSDEELHAIYKLEIPVDYVRDGILTSKDYADALEKEAKDGLKPLTRLSADELKDQAYELGIKITPDADKGSLVQSITSALERKKDEAKEVKEEIKEQEPKKTESKKKQKK